MDNTLWGGRVTVTSYKHRALALLAAMALTAATFVAAALPARAATTLTVCASGCDYTTLAEANTAAVDGDTIALEAGEFAGVVTITKDVVITGVGNGADPASNTIIKGAGTGTALTLNPGAEKSVTVENLRITGFDTGIVVGSNVTLENVVSTDNARYGINLKDGSSGLTIRNSTFSLNNAAVKIGSKDSASNIYIEGSHFDDNRNQGWYSDADTTVEPELDKVTIVNSTFNNNPDKGFYTERLSNAVFQNVEIVNSGNGRATQGAGLDLNLKFRTDFKNISLVDVTVHNSGRPPAEGVQGTVNGSGIAISARSDGATYGANPAELSGVLLEGVTVSGATNGIYFGFNFTEPPVVRNSFIYGNEYAIWNDTAGDWSPGVTVDAARNFWGSPSPDFATIFRGHEVSASPWYIDGALTTLAVSPTPGEPVVELPGGEDVVIVIPEGVDEPLLDVSSLQEADGSFALEDDVEIIAPNGASLQLAEGTVVTPSEADWDGLFVPLTVVSLTTVSPAGEPESEVILAVKVGSDDVSLEVDPAARLLLPGAAKKNAKVGFIAPGGTFTAITTQCAADSQDAGNAVERDCFIVVGDDIVIWTKHFTTFAAYTQVLASSGADQEFPFVPLTAALAAAGIGLVVLGRRREA